MDEDEDTRLFLTMLDAAAERIFEIAAAESSAVTVVRTGETFPESRSLQKDEKLCSELNPISIFPSSPQASSSPSIPRKRRKLFRTSSGMVNWPSLVGNEGKTESGDLKRFDKFSKEVHEAIDIIETTLQKLKNRDQIPTDQKRLGNLASQFVFRATPESVTSNTSRVQARVSLAGSSRTRRPNKGSNVSKFDHKSHVRVSSTLIDLKGDIVPTKPKPKMTGSQSGLSNVIASFTRMNMNGASRRKNTIKDCISDETSWSSLASSSGTHTRQSEQSSSSSRSYPPTETYSSSSGESEGVNEKVHQSSSQCTTGYETSSHNSDDQYSDTGMSNQSSSERPHNWDQDLREGNRVGWMTKMRRKIGTIYHHHHHHHHHHYKNRDPGFLKRLGNMFHGGEKDHHRRLKAEKAQTSVSKIMVKKNHKGRHFRALIDGLMKLVKHSKKSKNGKGDVELLGSDRHKTKKLVWRPTMGNEGEKKPKKRKVKFRAKTMKPQFAHAAKLILR